MLSETEVDLQVEDALIGLIAWVSALAARVRVLTLSEEATVIVPDSGVAHHFQIGYLPKVGPFLAYPAALWWFAGLWRAAAAGPAGIALVTDEPVASALFLPSDWPQALTEFSRLCSEKGSLALYPFAQNYAAALGQPDALPRPISDTADLDSMHGTTLSFCSKESFPWLDPVLRSPLPV